MKLTVEKVKKPDVKITLTAKEATLLYYFIENVSFNDVYKTIITKISSNEKEEGCISNLLYQFCIKLDTEGYS